jgi:single-stranded-DNA-specific exonuclease
VTKARADQGLWIDAAVTAAGATVPVLHAIEQAGPYGSAYPDPCFVLPAHRLTQVSEVQGGHLRLVLRAGDGSTIKGMAFRVVGKPLGQALLDQRNQTIHVAGRLSIDRYGGGEKAQIQVSDIAKPV